MTLSEHLTRGLHAFCHRERQRLLSCIKSSWRKWILASIRRECSPALTYESRERMGRTMGIQGAGECSDTKEKGMTRKDKEEIERKSPVDELI